MRRLLFLFLTAMSFHAVLAQHTIHLDGKWRLSDEGNSFEVTLPGSMLTNGVGHKVDANTRWTGSLYDSSYYFNPYMARYREAGRMKFPFFLTPSRHYVGEAWYMRSVAIPRQWKGRRVMLFLERPHIETDAYVNGHHT